MDLRPPRHARFHLVAQHVLGNRFAKFIDQRRSFRTRAHETHLTPQYIDQLRQLIQVRLPQPPPDRSDPRVIFRRPNRAGGLLGILDHAAKLKHDKSTTVQAHALLSVKYRPTGGALNRDGDEYIIGAKMTRASAPKDK